MSALPLSEFAKKPDGGFEPPTFALQVQRSTPKLAGLKNGSTANQTHHLETKLLTRITTLAGLEPAIPEGNGLAVHRLNHSATVSLKITTSAGLEPARAKHNGFQVHPLNHSGTMSLYYIIINV